MKLLFPFFILLLTVPIVGQAQIKIGTRIGISTYNLDGEIIEEQSLKLALRQANYGFHFGFFIRGPLSQKFYLQPELLFNSNSVDYVANDNRLGILNRVFGEKYQYLDIPLIVGYKLGPLHLEAGPVGHAYLASKTEMEILDQFQKRLNNFNLGYQAGVGLDILRLVLDIRFEGNFNDLGEYIHIGGNQLQFSQNSNRWVLTIGYSF